MISKQPMIIAEACQNHNGDLATLKEMIYAAKEAGADYLKIQSMLADELTRRERFEEGSQDHERVKTIKRPYAPEHQRLKPMDLDDNAHQWFIDECHKAGIKPMTTIFTFSRIKTLGTMDWDEVKVASYDCASLPFLLELGKYFRHLFISTGSTTDEEIRKTALALQGHSFSLLHCVTIYPTPLSEIHLKRIDWLRQFTGSVGFSDHTLVERDGLKASKAALYYGADIIERHFTILPAKDTKDGPVSVNPAQLKELVDFARWSKQDQKKYVREHIPEYEQMLGSAQRELSHTEKLNRDYFRGRFAMRAGGEMIYNWDNDSFVDP